VHHAVLSFLGHLLVETSRDGLGKGVLISLVVVLTLIFDQSVSLEHPLVNRIQRVFGASLRKVLCLV
jgi:hypothetical protein